MGTTQKNFHRTYARALRLGVCLVLIASASPVWAAREGAARQRARGAGATEVVLEGVARVHLPEGSLAEGTPVILTSRAQPSVRLPEGERLVGPVVGLAPDDQAFRTPAVLTLEYDPGRLPLTEQMEGGISLAFHNGSAWVRIADARVDRPGGSVTVDIHHGGEFVVLARERAWGIVDAPYRRGAAPIIVLHGLASGYDEWADFRLYCRARGAGPVWTFEYPLDRGVEEAAHLLAQEVNELTERHGPFSFNLVGHGVGGLVALRYGLDPGLSGERIARAIIALGAPAEGSELARIEAVQGLVATAGDLDDTLSARDLALLFSLVEAMGAHRDDLAPGGENEVLARIEELNGEFRRSCFTYGKGGQPRYRVESLSGSQSLLPARLAAYGPEEVRDGDGDTYVSISSTLLTPIEDAPFAVDHFELLHRVEVFEDVLGYIELGPIIWPELFEEIGTHAGRAKIVDAWEQEFRLNEGDERSFAILLDMARNFLRSTERNAILFTNGDNDTYPLWYVQLKDSLRADVAVVNLSLLNTSLFIKYLKGDPHHLPITYTDSEIDSLRAVWSGDKSQLVRKVADQVVEQMIEENAWERPLYLAVTLNPSNMALFDAYQRSLEGLVYRVRPTPPGEEPGTETDVPRILRNLDEVYAYDDLFDENGNIAGRLDPDIEMLLRNYAALYFAVGQELTGQGEAERAMAMYERALAFGPGTAGLRLALAEAALEVGREDEAEHWYREAFRANPDSYAALEGLATFYLERERRPEGIRLLARWLERHPEDERVLELMSGAGRE
jgi:pimeloyl-ACP methyl ester carboxylesterase